MRGRVLFSERKWRMSRRKGATLELFWSFGGQKVAGKAAQFWQICSKFLLKIRPKE